MDIIARIQLFFKFIRHSNKLDLITKEPGFNNFTKYENECLAIGLWEMFKVVNIPQFVIGMDSDAESLMAQYVCEKWPDLDIVDHSRKKIEITKNLINSNKNVYRFFKDEKFYVKKTQ